MKNSGQILKKLSEKMDIPVYVGAHLPYITVQGFEEVSIDLQKGLLAYSETEIIVAVSLGRVIVQGENLRIRLMREGKITLYGKLHSIGFEEEQP